MDILVILSVIGLLVYSAVRLLSKRFCDLCGRSALCSSVNGFRLCRKCKSIAAGSVTPIAELIAQNMTSRQLATSSGGGGWLKRIGSGDLAVLGGLVVAGYFYIHPESCRGPGQPPVAMSVRPSLVGIGNVIQIVNTRGDAKLTNVSVQIRNRGKNLSIVVPVGEIAPGEVKEAGTIDTGWVLEKSDTLSVTASGYDYPIVFTGDQLGVK